MPERKAIVAMNQKISSLLTAPSTDPKWDPKYPYTLRGVVNDFNAVYLRVRAPEADFESMSEGNASPPTAAGNGTSAPAASDETPSAPTVEKWVKVSLKGEDNTVEHTVSTDFCAK